MVVVDASVFAPALADAGKHGDTCRRRLSGQVVAAPDLLRVEVLSVVRRQLRRGELSLIQASNAIDDLANFPVTTHLSSMLVRRIWELRDNVTAYDACYVALAEALDCPLLTADAKLASASGTRCSFEVV